MVSKDILVLDLATKTGWARERDGKVTSGVLDLTRAKGRPQADCWIALNTWLCDNAEKVELVVYEMAHQRGGAATRMLHGLATTVETWCARHLIDFRFEHSARIKKHATGDGKASKGAVARAMVVRFPGITPEDDNESDALALLALTLDREKAKAA
jgi:Holliday junction resolvasome RuvABC endonuclease subunit